MWSTNPRKKNAQVGAAIHKGWESGGGRHYPVAGQVFQLRTLRFYNNDHVLSPPIDRGVDATVDDSCEDSNMH